MDVHDGLGADDTHTIDGGSSGASDGSGTDGGYGSGDGTEGSGDAEGSGDGTEGATTMIVEVEGRTRELPAEHDYTGDGMPDAAVETADGRVIVFADTEDNATGAPGPDGRADEAYVVDKQSGRVVGAAHIDPSSGTWVEDADRDGPSATGDPAGDATGDPAADSTGTGSTGDGTETGGGRTDGDESDGGRTGGDGSTDTTAGATPGSGSMTVDMDGRTQDLPAEKDYTGDGRPDAVVETKDGQIIVFSDTENNETGAAGPDGRADEAWIVDKSTGRVVGAAHVDPRTGEWVDGTGTGGPTTGEASS